MFSWVYKYCDHGRHGCGMQWCYSCKQAYVLLHTKTRDYTYLFNRVLAELKKKTQSASSVHHLVKDCDKYFQDVCVSKHEETTRNILEILKDDTLRPNARDAVYNHLEVMFGPMQHLIQVAEMFISLHKSMHVKRDIVETVQDKGVWRQETSMYSLYDILEHCANLEGNGECHMGCPFHDESLLVHLFAAAVFAAISALQTLSYEVAYSAFITALFHDCGKPASKKGGEGLCPRHFNTTVKNPCNHKGPGLCEHHVGCETNQPVQPPQNWSPFLADTDIMQQIKQFLVDHHITDAITEPSGNTPSWQVPQLVKCQLPQEKHEAFDAMIKNCSKPCDCARYPGHGLLGAICMTIFAEEYASTMPDTMTPMGKLVTVEAMIRTVQIHMALHNCGNAEVCHKVLAHENHLVRILASYMYVGDNLGKIRSGAGGEAGAGAGAYQEKVPFNEAYGKFMANMESLPVHASLVALNPGQKVTILLQGQSGSGKSTLVESLKAFLHECHRLCVISRDEQIVNVITGTQERLKGEKYATMYTVYNACKTYHKEKSKGKPKDIAKVHEAIRNAQEIGLQLSPAFTNVVKDNVPNVMQMVDSAFTEAYNTALDSKDVDVIVVDSCLTLWETAVQQHLPRLSETIVIAVPVINFAGIVSKANGLVEEKQMHLSGANTLVCPANDVFASPYFDPFGKKNKNTMHQAPPVILTMDNGVICPRINSTLKWIASALGDQPIIHPTHIDTSSMNGGAFMQHLVDKHNGDMLKVREELFKTWDVSMNGMCPYEQMTTFKKARIVRELVNFTSILHKGGILDKAITEDELASNDELFWNTVMSISVVKYKDGHNGSKFWVNEFMRHFRGITIFTHPITGKVTVLRYLMDRGAEIHSKVTNKRAARQDECDTNGQKLDYISKCLLEDNDLNAYLTQKADGSLGTFTVYSGMALAIMKAYVETWGTDVVKELARQSLEMTQGKFMVVLATQGTKSLSEDMTTFATTSIFGGIRNKEGHPLVSREKMSAKTPLQIWQEHGSKVIERVFAVHGPAYEKHQDDSITLMFELICAGNCGAFPGEKYHDEFACRAIKDLCLFLGLGYASLEVNIPHCVIDINGAFQQPAFWKIESGKQVNDMIRDLQLVMSGKMTKLQFITTYPPVNPMEFDELHPEGFVLYAYVGNETTPIHQAYGLLGILTYAKVKTLIYYMAHKFKVENLSVLVEYGRISPGHFPLCDVLYNIYSSGKLQQMMTRIHGDIKGIVDVKNVSSQLRVAIDQVNIKEEGDFKMNPLERLEKIKTPDPVTSFIGALLKEEATPKDVTLSRILASMLTGVFINGWNETFGASIQTLEEIRQLGEEGAKISMTAKARELFDKKTALSRKEHMSLLQTIKEAKPWSEEWQKVAMCTDVPTLLKDPLIKVLVELQNKASVTLPTTRGD
jgi:hypothetical protein